MAKSFEFKNVEELKSFVKKYDTPPPGSEGIYYQVYLDEQWEADCDTYEEAETIANGMGLRGKIDIVKRLSD